MTDLDELLEASPAAPETALGGTATPRRCRHVWATQTIAYFDGNGDPVPSPVYCIHCLRPQDPIRSRRGRQSRNYGNRAELTVARAYGGTKVGHHGGPVDVRGAEFNTQVKTHRRLPPAEWTRVFAALEASTDRLPRLLLRFVHTAGPTDYFVVPAKVWLEWFGRDDET